LIGTTEYMSIVLMKPPQSYLLSETNLPIRSILLLVNPVRAPEASSLSSYKYIIPRKQNHQYRCKGLNSA